jgi:putative radical SAM enzyme (TIGR03279 family)
MADRALEIISMKNPADFGLDPSLLQIGDKIVEVAGEKAADQLDWHFYASQGKTVSIKVERPDGRVEEVTLPSEAVAGLEIWFKAMDFRRCRCKCPFCFVDQMPGGLRRSLYVKDEDFRLSFLYGNFTTMNDITDAELDKIVRQKNSPQWVSVHVIDPEMREYVFGRPMKRSVVDTLRTMAEGGIVIHTQAVLVPAVNDGDYLRETIDTLEGLHPNIATLAIVPVGLTKHRGGLPELRTYRRDEMEAILEFVEPYRRRFLEGPRNSRFVFPSDEWYVGTSNTVPAGETYEGFPQLDNGVGSIRHFTGEIEADVDAFGVARALGNIRLVTGKLGARVFAEYVFPLLREKGVRSLPEIVTVENEFFGSEVTCSGLLVGADIVSAVRARDVGRADGGGTRITFIPPNCLNYDGVTIDEMTVGDLGRELAATVVAPEESFVQALQEHAEGSDYTV